jgi:ATP-dependent helicase/nuclease subunit B
MAWGALACIREHIEAKRYRIALVAQDRLVARRVRALLDRLGPNLTVTDQTGWKLSTTSAAAAVHSYLELMNSGAGPDLSTLLGFLKNPLLNWATLVTQLTDQGDLEAEPFAWFIESTLLAKSSGSQWSEWVQVFEPDQKDLHNHAQQMQYLAYAQKFMKYLRDVAQQWRDSYQSSHEWVELLKHHLMQFGMLDALQKDPAGQSVVKELEQLGLLKNTNINSSGWISLLDTWMEQASFVQDLEYQEVRIAIIPLASIRLNYFDAVVMVGCDDRQLPSQPDQGSIFSRAMLKALDDQLPVFEYLSQARDLSQLLMAHRHVDFIWQEYQKAQEVNRPAGWLTRLQMAIPSFKDTSIVLPIGDIQSQGIDSAKAQVLYSELLPTYISPSSYQSLRSCPYRFFVTYVLNLRSPKALQDFSEFGSIGTLLHEILKVFYRSYAKQKHFQDFDAKRVWMKKELEAISMEHWNRLIQQNGNMLYEQEQWMAQIPDWVEWQLHQEANGWKFVEAEKNLEFALQLANGIAIVVKGRADRIDQKGANEYRIWDYKFKNIAKLKKSQQLIDDDPQLLMYSNALIQNADPTIKIEDTGWVSLRNPGSKEREVLQEVHTDLLQELKDQMTSVLNQVWDGKPLLANGPSQVCHYCDARGLCRKGMWES